LRREKEHAGERFNPSFLIQANRAYELLQSHPDHHPAGIDDVDFITEYGDFLLRKANIHQELGHHTLAVATYREAEEFLAAADRKGLINKDGNEIWIDVVFDLGFLYIHTHQLEAAKRYFSKVLALPGISSKDQLHALFGMARHHKERKEWVMMLRCLDEVLTLLPDAKGDSYTEMRIFLFVADAAEARGDMRLAYAFDEKARKVWCKSKMAKSHSPELEACNRRQASELLAAGRPHGGSDLEFRRSLLHKALAECGHQLKAAPFAETVNGRP